MLALRLYLKEWTVARVQTVKEWVIFYLSLHRGAKQVTAVGRRCIKLWPQATGNFPRCFTFHNSNDKTSPLHSNGNQYHGWQSLWLFVKLGRCQLQCIASDLIFIFISALADTYSDYSSSFLSGWPWYDHTAHPNHQDKALPGRPSVYMSDPHVFISIILFHLNCFHWFSPLCSVVNSQPVSKYLDCRLFGHIQYFIVDNEKGQSAKDLSAAWKPLLTNMVWYYVK